MPRVKAPFVKPQGLKPGVLGLLHYFLKIVITRMLSSLLTKEVKFKLKCKISFV